MLKKIIAGLLLLTGADAYTATGNIPNNCWGSTTVEIDLLIEPRPRKEEGLPRVQVVFNKQINGITTQWNVGNPTINGNTWSFDTLDDQGVVGSIISFNNLKCNNGQLGEPLTFEVIFDGQAGPTAGPITEPPSPCFRRD